MVLLLAMELRRSEPEMGRGLVAAPLLNKLKCTILSWRSRLALSLLLYLCQLNSMVAESGGWI
jgi:hypothetical protein